MELNHRFLSPGWKLDERVHNHLPLDLLHLEVICSHEVCLRLSAKNHKKPRDHKVGEGVEVSSVGRRCYEDQQRLL